MSFQGDEYGKRTLDFVQRLQKLTRYEDICRHVVTELEGFGFTHVSSISLPGPGREATECILMNTRPLEYIDRYIEKNYVVRDPVVTELRKTVNPFSWSDVRGRRDLSKSEKAILDEGREFAARDGLTIPIVSLSGSMSLFCPCGLEPNLSERARAAAPPPLERLRHFLAWLLRQGEPLYAETIENVIDVDRGSDVALAEALAGPGSRE